MLRYPQVLSGRVSKEEKHALMDCSHCVWLGERAQWAHLFLVNTLSLLLIGWVPTHHQSWSYTTDYSLN